MSLKPGDTAPTFTLPTDSGGTVSLASLKGRIVVLYFYPKNDTSGCTREACDFRDAMPQLCRAGATVIGLSRDSADSHDRFKSNYAPSFQLASDQEGTTCEAYGMWVEKSMHGRKYMGIDRSTFQIDRDGVIRKIWRKVKVPRHVEEVLASLATI